MAETPGKHPMLIFVAGPQTGQRVRLSKPVAVLGRGPEAAVMLSEDFVSRQQARYELINAGPTLENLSARGTWINGKRFKAGKRVLLDTGDLIGAGAETQILFVSAADDADAALAIYEETSPRPSAFGRGHKAPAKPTPPEPQPIEKPTPVEAEEEVDESKRAPAGAVEANVAETPAEQERAKRKKLLVGLAVYLVLALAAIVVIRQMTGKDEGPDEGPAATLTGERIAEALAKPIKRTPNPVKENAKLSEAQELYQQDGLEEMNLHKCLTAFKEALAYGGREYFGDPRDWVKYNEVLGKLTEVVQNRYRRACALEADHDWRAAEAEFQSLLSIVPDSNSLIFQNVAEHLGRVRRLKAKALQEEKERRR